MFKNLKRFAIAGMTAVTLAGVSALAVATTSTGSGPLRHVAGGVAAVLGGQRPIDASAGGVASTSPGVTIALAPTATLTDRLLVAGTVTVQCPLIINFNGLPITGQGNVFVQQAAGNQVADGFGAFNVTCDGVSRATPYQVTPFNVAYHPGGAIAEASFGQNFTFCFFAPFGPVCASGDTGSVPITIVHR